MLNEIVQIFIVATLLTIATYDTVKQEKQQLTD